MPTRICFGSAATSQRYRFCPALRSSIGRCIMAIENIKFQQPVPPDAELELQLSWQEEKSLLNFSYSLIRADSAEMASSGKIRLC